MIEDTSKRDPLLHLLGALSDGQSGYIEGMEADGQRQLVNSDRLPTRMNSGTDEDLVALGFTLGDPDPRDPMFRPATLPVGWKREGSDHAMWSYLVDEHGRRRVSIFYKAAFYDRRAHMNVETPYGYLWRLVQEGGKPVLDETWLPADVAREQLEAVRRRELEDAENCVRYAADAPAGGDGGYWLAREKDHRAAVAYVDGLLASLPGATS